MANVLPCTNLAYEREGDNRAEKEDWMKRAIFLATFVLVLMLVLAPVALAQSPTPTPSPTPLPGAGGMPLGSAIALPAAALLLGAGILTYAILRRR
jgi:hypothetical protein